MPCRAARLNVGQPQAGERNQILGIFGQGLIVRRNRVRPLGLAHETFGTPDRAS